MQQFIYKGYKVEIYDGYNGDQIFIYKNGEKVYSARVCKGQGEERMKWVLR